MVSKLRPSKLLHLVVSKVLLINLRSAAGIFVPALRAVMAPQLTRTTKASEVMHRSTASITEMLGPAQDVQVTA